MPISPTRSKEGIAHLRPGSVSLADKQDPGHQLGCRGSPAHMALIMLSCGSGPAGADLGLRFPRVVAPAGRLDLDLLLACDFCAADRQGAVRGAGSVCDRRHRGRSLDWNQNVMPCCGYGSTHLLRDARASSRGHLNAAAPRPGRIEDLICPGDCASHDAGVSGLKAGGNLLGDVKSRPLDKWQGRGGVSLAALVENRLCLNRPRP